MSQNKNSTIPGREISTSKTPQQASCSQPGLRRKIMGMAMEAMAGNYLKEEQSKVLIPSLIKDLSELPEEIVLIALEMHRLQSKWFPHISEILELMPAAKAKHFPTTLTRTAWEGFAERLAVPFMKWPDDLGPAPGQPGCLMPQDIASKLLASVERQTRPLRLSSGSSSTLTH